MLPLSLPPDILGIDHDRGRSPDDVLSELAPDEHPQPHVEYRPLVHWLALDPDILRRAAYRATDAYGVRSADADDEVQEAAIQAYEDASAFTSAEDARAWLTSEATATLATRRGLASRVGPDEITAREGPDAMEAVVDARPAVAYASRKAGDRTDTLLACIRREITYREAGLDLDLSRQRAQQCASTLLAQLQKHQRAQDARCLCR